MSGNFHSLLNAAPQVETPPSPDRPVVAASKRGRPRIYPDAKTRRREYMRLYRAKQKVPRETFSDKDVSKGQS